MKNVLITLSILTFITVLFIVNANADQICTPSYNGSQTCQSAGQVTIKKKVSDPRDTTLNTYIDNANLSIGAFQPDHQINFQIIIINTGSVVIPQTMVNDQLPKQLIFLSGPSGSFNTNTNTLTFEVDSLNPGETRVFTLITKVIPAAQFTSPSTVCVFNQATASIQPIIPNQPLPQANSGFCVQNPSVITPASNPTSVQPGQIIQSQPGSINPQTVPGNSGITTKGGIPIYTSPKNVKATPSTGPETATLLFLIPTGALGMYLRKYTNSFKIQ